MTYDIRISNGNYSLLTVFEEIDLEVKYQVCSCMSLDLESNMKWPQANQTPVG